MKEDIDRFERQNQKDVVSIFQKDEEEEKRKLPVMLIRSPNSKNASGKTVIMLLMFKGDDGRYRYLRHQPGQTPEHSGKLPQPLLA